MFLLNLNILTAIQEHQRGIGCCSKGNPSRNFANRRSFGFEMVPLARKVRRGYANRTERRRNALAMTETLLKLIAAAAIIGLSSTPKKG